MKIIRMIDREMVMFLCKSVLRAYLQLNRNWQRVSDWNSTEKQYMSFVLKLLSSLRVRMVKYIYIYINTSSYIRHINRFYFMITDDIGIGYYTLLYNIELNLLSILKLITFPTSHFFTIVANKIRVVCTTIFLKASNIFIHFFSKIQIQILPRFEK